MVFEWLLLLFAAIHIAIAIIVNKYGYLNINFN